MAEKLMLLLMLLLTISAEVEKIGKPNVGEGLPFVSAIGFEPMTVCLEGMQPDGKWHFSAENRVKIRVNLVCFGFNVTAYVTLERITRKAKKPVGIDLPTVASFLNMVRCEVH